MCMVLDLQGHKNIETGSATFYDHFYQNLWNSAVFVYMYVD